MPSVATLWIAVEHGGRFVELEADGHVLGHGVLKTCSDL